MHRESRKNAPKDTPCPESAAASSLLALATVAMSARPALRSILTKQTVAPVVVVGGIDASIHPSPERKVRKTSHQDQIGKQNERKRKTVHAQARARATTLVKKRDVERAYQKMTAAEKEVFKRKMAEYDEADADDGETPPPIPTPI